MKSGNMQQFWTLKGFRECNVRIFGFKFCFFFIYIFTFFFFFFCTFGELYKQPQSWNIFGCLLEWKCGRVALHGGGKVMTRC